jgi:hypothetical protein
MKPVLMIHEVNDNIFKLPLENYILTFDDGLYSQYYHFDKIKNINTEKIFFISSETICHGQQSKQFPSCEIAHKKAFDGNYEDYMSIQQIKELMKDPQVTIGGHSHSHTNLNSIYDLINKIEYIKEDTKLMIEWFKNHLQFTPTIFCYPYNNDLNQIYKGILKTLGFTKFYGNERIPVESLLISS